MTIKYTPKAPRRRTICEVLRILAAHAEARNDATGFELLAEAEDYAKRMDAKLRQYAARYKEGDYRADMFGPKNIK